MTNLAAPLASAPVDVVLRRVACEIGTAADWLSVLEAQISALVAISPKSPLEQNSLQAFDHLSQQLQAVERFLRAAAAEADGEIVLTAALDGVRLESVRARLSGEETSVVFVDDEFW